MGAAIGIFLLRELSYQRTPGHVKDRLAREALAQGTDDQLGDVKREAV